MTKCELRLIYKPVLSTDNPDFANYTNGWTGPLTGTSMSIYPDMMDPTGLTSITIISGYTWVDKYMRFDGPIDFGSELGIYPLLYQDYSTNEALQDLINGGETNYTFQVGFNVKDNFSGGGITPYLLGQYGDTVYTDGRYEQDITVNLSTITDYSFGFKPSTGFEGGGVGGGITVQSKNPRFKRVDMYGDDSFALTFQITTDVAGRGASYSKTITLPGTANNNLIFNNLFNELVHINTTKNDVIFLNKKCDAAIYQEGLELIRGYFEVQSVKITDGKIEYEGTFFSNSKNLADSIGDKDIKGNETSTDNIDLSKYNHYFKYNEIRKTWLNTGSTTFTLSGSTVPMSYSGATGVYYPIIDYSGYDTGNEIRLENFKPAVYVKEVFDEIVKKAGFTYTSDFLNSSFFKSLVCPLTGKMEERDLNLSNTEFKVGLTDDYTGEGSVASHNYSLKDFYQQTPIDPKPEGTNNTIIKWYDKMVPCDLSTGTYGSTVYFNNENSYNTTNHYWRCNSSGMYSLWAQVYVDIYFELYRDINSNGNFTLYEGECEIPPLCYHQLKIGIYKNGVLIKDTEPQKVIWDYNTPVLSCQYIKTGITFSIDKDDLLVYKNDVLTFGVSMNANNFRAHVLNQSYVPVYTKIWTNVRSANNSDGAFFFSNKVESSTFYCENSTVYVNDALPDIKQIDFVKSIANKFNLVFTEDRNNGNNLIIEPWDTFYSGNTYVDWSDKVDISKEKKIERIPYIINKDMEFNFKDDSSDDLLKRYEEKIGDNYGDKTIPNPYLSESSEKVEDSFSSTMLYNLGSTKYIVSRIFNEDSEVTNLPCNSEFNPRVLQRKTVFENDTNGNKLGLLYVLAYDDYGALTGTTVTGYTLKTVGFIKDVYPYAGTLDNPYKPTIDINYGLPKYNLHWTNTSTWNNLWWLYWRFKIGLFMDPNSKYLTYYIRLNPADIANLDFRKKIMIDNSLYYLNKIIEWTPNESCKVELIKINPIVDSDYYLNRLASTIGKIEKKTNPVKSVLEIKAAKPTVYLDENIDITGYTFNDTTNYYPENSTGIIVGDSNIINSTNFTVFNSYGNTINSDDVFLINSHDNYIESGLTNVFLFGTTGQTITESNTIYINGSSSGFSGTSGSSGTSGIGSPGTSGTSGSSGISGDGTGGTSGVNGTSGSSGIDGLQGDPGESGKDGTAGTSGETGRDGKDGTSGISGTSGTSGKSGTSGTSGNDGISGTSGKSGTSGTSGNDGTSGKSGTAGTSGNGSSGTSGLGWSTTTAATALSPSTPSSTRYGTSGDSWLGTPDGWIAIDVGGNKRKIPYYV